MNKKLCALVGAAAVCTMGLSLFAACGGKTAVLRLEAGDGGTLGKSEYKVSVGSPLLGYLEEIEPAAEEGLGFAGWFKAEGALTEEDVMLAGGLTLTAKYFADYTVSLYLEGADGNYGEAETETGKAYYHEAFSYTPARENYCLDGKKENRLSTNSLQKHETFTAYLMRENVRITFSSGLEGTTSVAPVVTKRGESVILPDGSGFRAAARYRFLGWSEEEDGTAEYGAGESFTAAESVTLHAVWETGLVDRFGGSDIIFRGENSVTLLRGGKEFEGALDGDEFTFTLPGSTLSGKLYGDTFAYLHAERAGTYSLLEDGEVSEGQTLEIDGYGNATFRGETDTTNGMISSSPLGDWLFTDSKGNTVFRCRFPEHGSDNVFEKGGFEAGEYLDIYYVGASDIDTRGYTLVLDGYGAAVLTDPSRTVSEGSYEVISTHPYAGLTRYTVTVTAGGQTYLLSTLPLADGLNGFLFSDGYEGTYPGENGTSLALDGFGTEYSDGAVYTAGSRQYAGSYSVREFRTAGTLITLRSGDSSYSFLLNGETFTLLTSSQRVPVYELNKITLSGSDYRLADPLLVLYDMQDGKYPAELYVQKNDGSYELAATGEYEEEKLGTNLYLSTFRRTRAENGHADLAESFSYLVGGLQFENGAEEVYYVVEEDGEKKFQTWYEENGKGELRILDLPMGSLYYSPDGYVYQGTVDGRAELTDWDNMRVFRFTYYDFDAGALRSFTARYTESEGRSLFSVLESAPVNLFLTDRRGNTAIAASLALDGMGNAIYDGGEGQVRGVYAKEGVTPFGDPVYSFRAGNTNFLFITGTYYDVYSDHEYDVYYLLNEELEGSFSGEDGSSFLSDGYYRAAYSDGWGGRLEGTFFYTEDGGAVQFVAATGEELCFLFGGDRFELLGAEYGNWEYVDDNYSSLGFTAFFDGKGNAEFRSLENSFAGTYRLAGEYAGLPEAIVRVDFGKGEKTFTVSFMKTISGDRYCVPRNDGALGAFVSEDWDVLVLDGYGYGTFYGSDGSAGRRGIYTLYGAEKGHLSFLFSGDYTQYLYVTLGGKDGSFRIQSYEEYSYYSDDFSGIRFGGDGRVNLLGESGVYFVGEEGASCYFMQDDTTYAEIELFLPGTQSAGYGGKQYQLFTGGEKTLNGRAEFLDEEGSPMPGHPSVSLTVAFTPDGFPRFSVPAAVTADAEEYNFTLEASYPDGNARLELVYEGVRYPLRFEGNTFTVNGGEQVTEINDINNTGLSHGTLTFRSFGLGPIGHGESTVHGELAYTVSFTFDVAADSVLVIGSDGDYGDRYLILFESEGVTYSMSYHLFSGAYMLYALARYSAVETNGYTLGVCCYLYDAGDFTLLSRTANEVCDLVLFEDGKPVPRLGLTRSGSTFLYTEEDENGAAGRTFAVSGLSVRDGKALSATVEERMA